MGPSSSSALSQGCRQYGVGGELNAAQRREAIAPALEAGAASALVLRLPGDAAERRDWAYFGIEMTERTGWLGETLGSAQRTGSARSRGTLDRQQSDRQQRKG